MPFSEVRHINLKEGMPYVDEAIKRLNDALSKARRDRVDALILVHGYGSKGVGGKIRVGIQQELRILQQTGHIRAWVAGEKWEEGNRTTDWIIQECPGLEDDPDLGAGNPGMSIVLI